MTHWNNKFAIPGCVLPEIALVITIHLEHNYILRPIQSIINANLA